jgi:hypothetical protein
MTARTDAYERELARSVDADCDDEATDEYDAMDDADSAYERAGDR